MTSSEGKKRQVGAMYKNGAMYQNGAGDDIACSLLPIAYAAPPHGSSACSGPRHRIQTGRPRNWHPPAAVVGTDTCASAAAAAAAAAGSRKQQHTGKDENLLPKFSTKKTKKLQHTSWRRRWHECPPGLLKMIMP